MNEIPDLDIAVTAGQLKYVPFRAKEVIDIGWRCISTSTLLTIITSLNLHNDIFIKKLNQYSRTVINLDFKNTTLDKISKLQNILNIVIDQIDYGVIVTNITNKVIYTNKSFLNMINADINFSDGFYLEDEIIPKELYDEIHKTQIVDNSIIFLKKLNRELIISRKPIELYGETLAHVITFIPTC